MLTPDQAKTAFLASVPRRRAEFARRIDDKRRTIAHESGYVGRYPKEVMLIAEEEIRARHHSAAERIKAVLDSGWTPPHPTAIRSAFTGCFQFMDYREDPFSDVYDRVERAYAELGQPVPPGVLPKRELGEVQSQVVKECLSDLEMYVPKRQQQPSATFHNYGPIGAQQVGDGNVANVNQTVTSLDVATITSAVQAIRAQVADLPQTERQEVEEHLASIDEEIGTPTPRASRLKTWFRAIGRVAAPLAESGVKTVTEAAVATAVKSLTGVP
jgi:hypothetical protein